MLNNDLTVTPSGAGTKSGTLTAKVFALVASLVNNKTLRRISATALTTPQEVSVQHSLTGTGFKARVRTAIRYDYRDLTQDTTQTAGVVPSFAVYLVIDRPVQSAGKITEALIKDGVGALQDITMSGTQLTQLLNMEG
jgi:hypothetical protein